MTANHRAALSIDVLEICISEHIPPDAALKIAQTVLENISMKQIPRAERNRIIRTEWNGRNTHELMRRFGISRSTLYRIING